MRSLGDFLLVFLSSLSVIFRLFQIVDKLNTNSGFDDFKEDFKEVANIFFRKRNIYVRDLYFKVVGFTVYVLKECTLLMSVKRSFVILYLVRRPFNLDIIPVF